MLAYEYSPQIKGDIFKYQTVCENNFDVLNLILDTIMLFSLFGESDDAEPYNRDQDQEIL